MNKRWTYGRPEEKDIRVGDELFRILLDLPKFFKDAEEGEFAYTIPGYGDHMNYAIVADRNDAAYGSETFKHKIFHGPNPTNGKFSLNLVATNSNTVLCRFDLGKKIFHNNPNTKETIRGNHMHFYERPHVSSLAYKLPDELSASGIVRIVEAYLDRCNISRDNLVIQEALV